MFWLDEIAERIIEREERLGRKFKVIRAECGIGASGIPHLGSVSDAVRAFGVVLALRDKGKDAELIAFSDDRDGLRKVPLGFPDWLEKELAKPVTDIRDPFGCHSSYGEHMSSLLIDALEKLGIDFEFYSGTKAYEQGILNEQVEKALLNSKEIGELVEKITGQKKYLETIPYFPVCENCGRIYTTRVVSVLPEEKKVLYVCDQSFVGKNLNTGKEILVKGCGYEGEASYLNGRGKLSWKVELAARWDALKISFEAYGKDIAASVKVNDVVSKKIFGFEPPLHVMYEMFLEKGGRKISKSVGNVFTPQAWLEYGSPQSLLLLMFKRFSGTREIDVTDIPTYMDEVDRLEKIYFGLERVGSEKKERNLRRLFEYVHLLKPPEQPSNVYVSYATLVELVKVAPEGMEVDFVAKRLEEQGLLESVGEKEKKVLEEKLKLVKKWVEDFEREKTMKVELKDEERLAVEELIEKIELAEESEELQKEIFEVARKHGIKPANFFRLLYRILLGREHGPRLGPYIFEVGKERIVENLRKALGN